MNPSDRTVKSPTISSNRKTKSRFDLLKRSVKKTSENTSKDSNPMDRATRARMDLLKRFAIGSVTTTIESPNKVLAGPAESEIQLTKDSEAVYVDPMELLAEDHIDILELRRNKRRLPSVERAVKSQVNAVEPDAKDKRHKTERRGKKPSCASDQAKLHGHAVDREAKGFADTTEHAAKARADPCKRSGRVRGGSTAAAEPPEDEMSMMERRMKELVSSIERAAKANVDAMESGMPVERRPNERRIRWPMNSMERIAKVDVPADSMECMAKSFVDSMERSISRSISRSKGLLDPMDRSIGQSKIPRLDPMERSIGQSSKTLLDPIERLAKEPLNSVEQMINWNSKLNGL